MAVGSANYMTCPFLLQYANSDSYIGDFPSPRFVHIIQLQKTSNNIVKTAWNGRPYFSLFVLLAYKKTMGCGSSWIFHIITSHEIPQTFPTNVKTPTLLILKTPDLPRSKIAPETLQHKNRQKIINQSEWDRRCYVGIVCWVYSVRASVLVERVCQCSEAIRTVWTISLAWRISTGWRLYKITTRITSSVLMLDPLNVRVTVGY